MGNALRNKVIQFHEKIVFDFLKKIRNYLVANPIYNETRLQENERLIIWDKFIRRLNIRSIIEIDLFHRVKRRNKFLHGSKSFARKLDSWMRGVCRGRRIYEALILHALESVNEGEEEAEEEKTRLFGLTISPFAPDFSLHVESTTWAYNVGAVNKPHLHIRINKTDGPICMLSAFNLFLFFFLFFYSNEP